MREAKPSDIWTLDRGDLVGTINFLRSERIYPLTEEVVYNAIFDTVLAATETFSKQRNVLKTLKDFGYTNPDTVLRNEEEFARLMNPIRFNKSKTKTLVDICNYCENESDVVQGIIRLGKRINSSVKRQGTIGEKISDEAHEFRDSLTDMPGIGTKSATMLLLHLGAVHDMVVIDIWASRFGKQALGMDIKVHDYGKGRAPQGRRYLEIEDELNERLASIDGFNLPSSIVITSIWRKYSGNKSRKSRYGRPYNIITEDGGQMMFNSESCSVDNILTQGFIEESQRIKSVEQLLLPKRGWRNPILTPGYKQERFAEPSPHIPPQRIGKPYVPQNLEQKFVTDYVPR